MQSFHQLTRSFVMLGLLIFMLVIGFSGMAFADKQHADEKAAAADEKAAAGDEKAAAGDEKAPAGDEKAPTADEKAAAGK